MDVINRNEISYEIMDYRLIEDGGDDYGVEGPYEIKELKIKINNDEPKWFDMYKEITLYNFLEYVWDKFGEKEGKVMKKEGCYDDLIGRKGVGEEICFSDGYKKIDLRIL